MIEAETDGARPKSENAINRKKKSTTNLDIARDRQIRRKT